MGFFWGFSTNKLKPQLKMASHRLTLASNKKAALMKQQRREIATLLNQRPRPKEEKARIRAEGLIRDDYTIEAYELLQLSCDLVAERVGYIASRKDCPNELVSTISTLIWAAGVVDIPELDEIKKQFRYKYGKDFVEDAMTNKDSVLNERVCSRLGVEPPNVEIIDAYLLKIADEFEVDWSLDSNVARRPDQRGQPMSSPIGYSVESAGPSQGGSELSQKMKENAPIPIVTATYAIPPPNGGQEEEEEEIYIPPAPSGRPSDIVRQKSDKENNTDN